MWAASLDLKDAYLHIPIAPASQRFLAFEYRGESLKFTTLPFGLSTSPRVFTRVAGAVVAELRRRGVLLFAYLDDWLVLGDSLEQAEARVRATITLLQQTGWVINWDKSHPTPTQALVYLGALLDLERGRAFPSQERCSSLKGALTQLLADPWSRGVLRSQALCLAPRTLCASSFQRRVAPRSRPSHGNSGKNGFFQSWFNVPKDGPTLWCRSNRILSFGGTTFRGRVPSRVQPVCMSGIGGILNAYPTPSTDEIANIWNTAHCPREGNPF